MSFLLYRASAGSGKTYTLVKEYLKLVLDDPETFKHILAVTFTNKAAAEMKERILQALKDLSKGQDKVLENYLKKENKELGDIASLSSDLVTRLLHNYSDFAIMTIDSFIHRVLRAFSLELGLPLTFSIDLNYEDIFDYVIERLIGQVGRDTHITRVILSLVNDRLNQGKSWNIEPDIRRFVGELFNEKNTDWANEIDRFGPYTFEEYRNQLNAYRGDFLRKMREQGSKAVRLIQESGLGIDDFAQKKRGPAGFLHKIADLGERDLYNFKINSYLEKENWYAKSTPPEIKEGIETLLQTGLSEVRQKVLDIYDKHFKPALTAHFMLEDLYLAAIVGEIKVLIDEYKKRYNVVPIADFNKKVYEIVTRSPVPFIYEMMGERFICYLIDEFQDTSRMQWENLFPLIDNALASGYFNLAVGDGKQSIYRWRGGDVEIMESEIRRRLPEEQLNNAFLEENYRSREAVITFNNGFFLAIHQALGEENRLLKNIYHEADQFVTDKKGGLVSLQFVPQTSRKEEADPMVFDLVDTIVEECIDTWHYREKDIAILTRTKKEGRKIAEHLLEQKRNYSIVSPDSLVLAKIPLVRFLVDVLRYLNNPEDLISRAAIIHYLCLHKKTNPTDAETVGDFIRKQDPEFLQSHPEIHSFFKRRDWLIRLPVYEALEEVIRIFQVQTFLDFNTAGYLQAFLDVVSHFSTENNVDFSSFLDWWENNEEEFSVEVPEDVDAIKIMTIHKAKGLEFPVLIVPYADWQHELDRQLWLKPDPGELKLDPPLEIPIPIKRRKELQKTFFEKELQEEKKKVEVDNVNLLYVAFTRAVDRLYIISGKPKENNRKSGTEKKISNAQLLWDLAVPLMKEQESRPDHFVLGEPAAREESRKKRTETDSEEVTDLISTRWYNKITIRRKATEFWRFDRSYTEEKRTWGILVHKVLSTISSSDDVQQVVTGILNSGDIEVKERRILAEKINEIFRDETVKGWFDPKHQVFTESPIITDEGVLRPDRVMVADGRVKIIDFKTGVKLKTHENQLRKYKDALENMGYDTVEAFLLYLEDGEVRRIEDGR
jgi:ATP-dependent exoDNAse (exonuclease V) beta subunit